MPITKIDPVWAENADSGDLDTPTDAKKEVGHKAGDKVYKEWRNWFWNRVETKLNTLCRERVNSFYDNATDAEAMITTGQWDDSWGITSDTANIISAGATKEIVDIAVYFVNNEPRLILLDAANAKMEIWDPRSRTLLDTSDAMTDDLPTGGGEDWQARKLCTDGTSAFVVLSDINPNPNDHRVQAWDLSTWSVKTGWPATGTGLGDGPEAGNDSSGHDIIIADSSKLAVLNSWDAVTAASTAVINIVNISDGTVATSGAGDCTTGASYEARGICSDGTNIFFFATDGTDGLICTATIANAQVGCGGTGYPQATTGATDGRLVSCGPNLVVSALHFATPLPTDTVLRTHNSGASNHGKFKRGESIQGTDGDEYIYGNLADITFDGINIWILSIIEIVSQAVLLKFDVAKMQIETGSTALYLGDVSTGRFLVSPEEGAGQTNTSVTFDGRDIWATVDARASQTDSGKVFRLPIAILRS